MREDIYLGGEVMTVIQWTDILMFFIFITFNTVLLIFIKGLAAEKQKTKYKYDWVLFVIINSVCMLYINISGENNIIHTMIFLIFAVIIEQKIYYKDELGKAIFAATLVAMNISTIYYFVQVAITINYSGLGNFHAVQESLYKGTVGITFLTVLILLILWERYFTGLIGELNKSKAFMNVIISANIIISGLMIYNVLKFFEEETFLAEIVIALISAVFSSTIYYQIFIFTVKFSTYSKDKKKAQNLEKELKKLNEEEEKLEHLRNVDPLMGIYNRRFIMNELESICNDYQKPFAVFFADVNKLKQINDTYGHKVGDEYLKASAKLISEEFTQLDKIGRIGGDEVLIICEDVNERKALEISNNIEKALKEKNHFMEELEISVSVGYAIVTKNIADKGSKYILNLADLAMRKKKKSFYEREGRSK